MRLFATLLLVACLVTSIAGCRGRGHRRWCLFGKRHHHGACVDQNRWDHCDSGWDNDFDDDDDGGCPCGCHGHQAMPQCAPPMPSFDAGCGCDGMMPMPSYPGSMPMSFDSFPQSGGCSSCGTGGVISGPSYPTFDHSMMSTPTMTPTPTPTPAAPPSAPAAESYYNPNGSGTNASTSTTIPPKY